MQSKVSVIIPAYNHERFVGAAVESVLGQSHRDVELIVINDGSTDRTGEVVQSYGDDRIVYRYQDNRDAYNTINRGLSMVTGDYVAILNSDDVYFPARLERLIAARLETGAECLFTDVVPISDEGEEFTDPAFGWNVWHRKNREFLQGMRRSVRRLPQGQLHGHHVESVHDGGGRPESGKILLPALSP